MSHPPLPPRPGAHGVPPGAAQQPPPPRRPRPSGWWFALGGGLVLAAVVAAVGLFAWTLTGFLGTDATLSGGGSHRVTVDPHGDRMLWLEDGFGQRCVIEDRATGTRVPLAEPGGELHRSDGSGDWTGAARFDPGSGRLLVTCDEAEGAVLIGPAPQIGSFMGGLLATVLVPMFLGVAGLVVLLVTGIRFAAGAPRRRGTSNESA